MPQRIDRIEPGGAPRRDVAEHHADGRREGKARQGDQRIEAVGDPDVLNVMADELTPERKLSAWQELKRVGRAFNDLPPRCRQIVWLKKVDELSMREVAEVLGLSVRTVENQVLKGMRLLSNTVYGSDAPSAHEDSEVVTERAAEHGKQ